jgi:hypothetical protein
VTWQAHFDDKTSSKEAAYDMIMGVDLMTSIVISVDCEQRCIRWGGTEIPLKTRTTLNDNEILHLLYHAANEPDILQEAENRQNRMLDADYRKVEVDPYVQELAHLTKGEKQVLGETLKKFPTLFGGGLGMLMLKSRSPSCASQQTHRHSSVQNPRRPSCARLQMYRDHSAP